MEVEARSETDKEPTLPVNASNRIYPFLRTEAQKQRINVNPDCEILAEKYISYLKREPIENSKKTLL